MSKFGTTDFLFYVLLLGGIFAVGVGSATLIVFLVSGVVPAFGAPLVIGGLVTAFMTYQAP